MCCFVLWMDLLATWQQWRDIWLNNGELKLEIWFYIYKTVLLFFVLISTSTENPNSHMCEVGNGRSFVQQGRVVRLNVQPKSCQCLLVKASEVNSKSCSSSEAEMLFGNVLTLTKKGLFIHWKLSPRSRKYLWRPHFKPSKWPFTVHFSIKAFT